MGCQQTILSWNESSFESQAFFKVDIGYRHTLLSSNTSYMEAQSPNKSFLVVPGTSSSLNVAKAIIQNPFSDTSINTSFVPVTSSAPSVDPNIVPRLVPSYVTDLEISKDTKFSNSIGNFTDGKFFPVSNKPKTILNLNSSVNPRADIQRDPIIVSTVGPRVVPDTEPSVDSRENPSFDPDYH